MRSSQIAAYVLYLVCVFQLALVFGAPWGSLTQGGFDSGALETPARITAAISLVLLFLMAQVILALDGRGMAKSWNRKVIRILAWVATAYSGTGIVMNLASPSLLEKLIWVPVTAAVFYLQLRTLLRTRKA